MKTSAIICPSPTIHNGGRPSLAGTKNRTLEAVSRPDRARSELLEMLRCPRCRGQFASSQGQHDPGFDIWRCSCNKWPVVAGIPILSGCYILPTGQRLERVVSLIEGSQYKEALLSLLLLPPKVPTLAPSWVQSLPAVIGIRRFQRLLHERRLDSWTNDAVDLVLTHKGKGSACALFDLRFRRSAKPTLSAYDYFACRFGQPRHLIALSLMTLLDNAEGPVLDLGCGPGHMTFSLLRRGQTRPVIGIDRDFTMLYIANQRIAPEGHFICMNADQRLPFSDGFLSGVLCSDAFHYFVEKATAVDEMFRTVHENGVIALAVLRNSNFEYEHGGLPLTPEEYSRLFDSLPHRILPDEDVLTSYLQKRGPQLAGSASAEALKRSPMLSLVACAHPELLCNHREFAKWPHAAGTLAINPLYRVSKDSRGVIRLERTFPSEYYEQDHTESKRYLPEHVDINLETLVTLAEDRYSEEAENLIRQCAIVAVPENYGMAPTLADLLRHSGDGSAPSYRATA